MENNTSKNIWIGLGVAVLVIVGIWFMNKSSAPIVSDTSTNTNQAVDSTEDTTAGSVNTGAGAVTLSYANALIKYKDARIQLDKICQASPDKGTFKNGTVIMIDNRAPVARTVKVGSVFGIKAFGFKLVKLESATLPATWYVDCDKSQNVSTILIQK